MRDLLLGLSTVLGPLLAGALLGALARRLVADGLRRRLVPALAALSALSPLALAPWIPVGVYDLLLMSACFALALYAAGRPGPHAPPPRAGVALAAGIVVLGLGAAELVARRLPHARRPEHRPDELHFVFQNTATDFSCDAMTSARNAPSLVGARTPGRRRVVHLGDSMVAAFDAAQGARFTTLVQQGRPAEEHVPFGHIGVGPDVYLYLVHGAVPALRPDEVVLYLFLGNDFFDIDRPHPCCGMSPILDYSGGAARPRCDLSSRAVSLRHKLQAGPAPYLLRVLAWRSTLAAVLSARFEAATRGAHRWSYEDWFPVGDQVEHTVAALRAIRAELDRQHVGLTLVLLPPRWALERHDPRDPLRAARDRVLRAAAADHIRAFDSWDLFQDAVDRDPASDWFQRESGNPHFGVAGHRLFARWMLDRVLAHP